MQIQVAVCPFCAATHEYQLDSLPRDNTPTSLICPLFGDVFQAEIRPQAVVLPIQRFNFGPARQQRLLPLR